MDEFDFRPIAVKASAPGGPCLLLSFDDIKVFIENRADIPMRGGAHWYAVRRNIAHARFGAYEAEVHEAMRMALQMEGWLVP